MEFVNVFLIALFVECLWESLKPLWPAKLREAEKAKGVPVDKIGAFIVAQVLCFAYQADLPALLGLKEVIPYVGIVITGGLMYRGSTSFHNVVKTLISIRNGSTINYVNGGGIHNDDGSVG